MLSTLERRYNYSSVSSGLLASTFDITLTLLVVFVSFFGGRSHKARLLGIGCLTQGIGCLVFASPQFIFFNNVRPEAAGNQFQVCLPERNSTTECVASNSIAYVILLLGQVLIGAGATPLFTLGISYLDELVHPRFVSLHLAAVYILQLFGPAVGFGIGGALLSVYIDPWVRTKLQQSDPAFLGAWWIAYILAGILSLLISVPFFMFPRMLQNAEEKGGRNGQERNEITSKRK